VELIARRSALRGRIRIPGSKSHTIRAVAAAALAGGESEISEPLVSLDTAAAVGAYRALGAGIDDSQSGCWRVRGLNGRPQVPEDVIDCGNSGTTMRLLAGSCALIEGGHAVLTGDEQVRRRPMGPLLSSLADLGAEARSKQAGGRPPVVIGGRLSGGRTRIEAVTSQFLSSLLMACPLASGESEIEVPLLNERPYVEMTLAWLEELGIRLENEDFRRFRVPGAQAYRSFRKEIPADWSSATFFLAAGALVPDSDVTLTGLDMDDSQGDRAVVGFLREMGARIEETPEGLRVRPGELRGARLDLNATPDALPALAFVAACARGRTELVNVAQARLKETDRIAVLAGILKELGVRVEEREDGLVIEGGAAPRGGLRLPGHDDHRIVMATAVAGLAMKDGLRVDTAEAAGVTFPGFAELVRSLGGELEEA